MDSLLANFQIVFETLGCRLNQVETEAAMNFFSASCFPVFVNSAPDIKNENVLLYVLNTCAVTQKAEQKAFRQIKKILEKYKNATLLVTGCYAELSKDFIKNIDKRIAVIPGKKKSFISRVPAILKECVTDFNPEIFSNKIENLLDDKLFQNNPFVFSPVSFFSHSRASLKIQDGCNSACTYCAIRLARGASTSLSVEEVLERVVKLEESGQNEVVFTAVNLAHYRSAYKNETYNFEKLLALLLQKTQNIAFRISSVYPELISESFCKIIESKRVRPHFHISVQSGSDKILSLMGRKYRKSDVIK
ncbi:MAG: radical SAM protein, partial [Treponema sp.]|nr:radical SAM protein [Treponema sp.]